jgi:hypothetical protein
VAQVPTNALTRVTAPVNVLRNADILNSGLSNFLNTNPATGINSNIRNLIGTGNLLNSNVNNLLTNANILNVLNSSTVLGSLDVFRNVNIIDLGDVTFNDGDITIINNGGPGTPGTNGADGADGTNGADGADGADGLDGGGAIGIDGIDGAPGRDGIDGGGTTTTTTTAGGGGGKGALALTGFTALPLLGGVGLLLLAGAGMVRGAAGRFFPTV